MNSPDTERQPEPQPPPAVAAPEFTTYRHSLRTALAAAASLALARLFSIHESYWAPITTLIVMQSTLGASLKISLARICGTAVGSVVGAIAATYFKATLIAFAGAVFITGIIATTLHLQRIAYRYATIAMTIIFLIARTQSPWITASHRFVEVTIGIAVGLAVTAVFPEKSGTVPDNGKRSPVTTEAGRPTRK